MSKKILFLHGFMGSPSEGKFLTKLGHDLELHCLELPNGDTSSLKSFYKQIDLINPQIIYGYSLGGRVALDYLNKTKSHCETLILESVSFGITQETRRLERLKEDQSRAKTLSLNFKTFLEYWYDLEIWGELTSQQKEKLITKRLNNWNDRTDLLSQMIVNYSPGAMASIARNTIDAEIIYIYGKKDLKYKSIAQELSNVHLIEIEGSGHNIHEFSADLIVKRVQKYL